MTTLNRVVGVGRLEGDEWFTNDTPSGIVVYVALTAVVPSVMVGNVTCFAAALPSCLQVNNTQARNFVSRPVLSPTTC